MLLVKEWKAVLTRRRRTCQSYIASFCSREWALPTRSRRYMWPGGRPKADCAWRRTGTIAQPTAMRRPPCPILPTSPRSWLTGKRRSPTPSPSRSPASNRTWAELAERVRRAAAGLRAAGLAPGDRIAVLDLNHPSCLELTLACAQVGTANAVVNFRLAPPEIAYVINDAKARLLFVGPEFARRGREAARSPAGGRARDPHRRRRRRVRSLAGRTRAGSARPPLRARRLLRAALHLGHDRLPEGRDAHAPRHAGAFARTWRGTSGSALDRARRSRCRCSTSAARAMR